jgi:LPS export ABC transporter protein LptC/lipopolysaccharide transport protein LptA
MFRDRLPYFARLLSLVLLMSVAGALVVAFIKRGSQLRPAPPIPRVKAGLSEKVVAVTEGYRFLSSENGQKKFQLVADRDTSYADGRHELEKLDLIAYAPDGRETGRIRAAHGSYRQDSGQVTFTGQVLATSADGLEVATEALTYDQHNEIATSDVAISFRRAEMSGSAVGAVIYLKDKNLALLQEARLVIAPAGPKPGGPPLEVRGQRADYAQPDGIIRFSGEVSVTQGARAARADVITAVLHPQTRKLLRVEARGQAGLKSQEPGKSSELQARDLDFFFDEAQHLKLAIAQGGAQARSLEPSAPREIMAEKLEARYAPTAAGSELTSLASQGRTSMKLAPTEGAPNSAQAAERMLEADSVQLTFRPGGHHLARAEANGNAVLTITPPASVDAERKRIRAPRFRAEFYETNNAIKSFLADGGAVVEFEPLPPGSERPRRTLSGKRLTAGFDQGSQEVAELTLEGEAKFTDGERHATAARAVYRAAASTVALRGQPLIWDAAARTNAEEIDANLDSGESVARGRVRTTYYSRETTGGAAPFKQDKSPVFIAADRAIVRHDEGAARYEGNARAWQDDNFVRADTIELDKNERALLAAGNVQSALYRVERETDKGRTEVVPIFASAERMTYRDAARVVQYENQVKIKQGTDRIEAAVAEAVLDEEHRLARLTAARNVVLTQPARRGTGDKVEYTAATDTAVLTGNLARLEDREREVVTSGARLTLHLRDAKIEADDEGGTKRVRTTHRIQP